MSLIMKSLFRSSNVIAVASFLSNAPTLANEIYRFAAQGNIEMVGKLLELGADINEREKESHYSLLDYAEGFGHYDMIQFLRMRGADTSFINNRRERVPYIPLSMRARSAYEAPLESLNERMFRNQGSSQTPAELEIEKEMNLTCTLTLSQDPAITQVAFLRIAERAATLKLPRIESDAYVEAARLMEKTHLPNLQRTAAAIYEKAANIFHNAHLYKTAGHLYEQLDAPESAARCFEKANLPLLAANVFERAKKYNQEAIQLLTKCKAYKELAETYLRNGDLEHAAETYITHLHDLNIGSAIHQRILKDIIKTSPSTALNYVGNTQKRYKIINWNYMYEFLGQEFETMKDYHRAIEVYRYLGDFSKLRNVHEIIKLEAYRLQTSDYNKAAQMLIEFGLHSAAARIYEQHEAYLSAADQYHLGDTQSGYGSVAEMLTSHAIRLGWTNVEEGYKFIKEAMVRYPKVTYEHWENAFTVIAANAIKLGYHNYDKAITMLLEFGNHKVPAQLYEKIGNFSAAAHEYYLSSDFYGDKYPDVARMIEMHAKNLILIHCGEPHDKNQKELQTLFQDAMSKYPKVSRVDWHRAMNNVGVSFVSPENVVRYGTNCVICQEGFKTGSTLSTLPCNHTFDKACFDPFLHSGNRNCPICRRPYNPNDVSISQFFSPTTTNCDANSTGTGASSNAIVGMMQWANEFMNGRTI